MGTVLLGMSEAAFWRCTPRKLFALWEIHKRVNGFEGQEQDDSSAMAYIDQFI